MAEAFSFSLDQWLYFGGYPGAAELVDNETQWATYVTDSLIETVITKDVLQMQTVAKPALLRHLWALEVKSGGPGKTPGLSKFCRLYPEAEPMVIGSEGTPLEGFFTCDLRNLLL